MEDLLASVHLLLLESAGRTALTPGRDLHPCSKVKDPRRNKKISLESIQNCLDPIYDSPQVAAVFDNRWWFGQIHDNYLDPIALRSTKPDWATLLRLSE